jgi:hypothetical protein
MFVACKTIVDACAFRRDQGEEGEQMVQKLRRVLLAYRLLLMSFVVSELHYH